MLSTYLFPQLHHLEFTCTYSACCDLVFLRPQAGRHPLIARHNDNHIDAVLHRAALAYTQTTYNSHLRHTSYRSAPFATFILNQILLPSPLGILRPQAGKHHLTARLKEKKRAKIKIVVNKNGIENKILT
jgi:hypothetical protein